MLRQEQEGREAEAKRDIWMAMLLAVPLVFAFDQGIRQALLSTWVPVNLLTVAILRPSLDYLAMRSLLKWMRVDWRGFGALAGPLFALDAMTFGIGEVPAVTAATLTGFACLIVKVLLEYGPDPKKRVTNGR